MQVTCDTSTTTSTTRCLSNLSLHWFVNSIKWDHTSAKLCGLKECPLQRNGSSYTHTLIQSLPVVVNPSKHLCDLLYINEDKSTVTTAATTWHLTRAIYIGAAHRRTARPWIKRCARLMTTEWMACTRCWSVNTRTHCNHQRKCIINNSHGPSKQSKHGNDSAHSISELTSTGQCDIQNTHIQTEQRVQVG